MMFLMMMMMMLLSRGYYRIMTHHKTSSFSRVPVLLVFLNDVAKKMIEMGDGSIGATRQCRRHVFSKIISEDTSHVDRDMQ